MPPIQYPGGWASAFHRSSPTATNRRCGSGIRDHGRHRPRIISRTSNKLTATILRRINTGRPGEGWRRFTPRRGRDCRFCSPHAHVVLCPADIAQRPSGGYLTQPNILATRCFSHRDGGIRVYTTHLFASGHSTVLRPYHWLLVSVSHRFTRPGREPSATGSASLGHRLLCRLFSL